MEGTCFFLGNHYDTEDNGCGGLFFWAGEYQNQEEKEESDDKEN